MNAIRSRAGGARRRERTRALVACAALVCAIGAGAGLGAKLYGGVNVWLFGDKAAIVVSSLVTTSSPTASQLREVIDRATFPVVLPAGLPPGAQAIRILYAPPDRPTSITIQYRSRRSSFTGGFTLMDSRAVNTDAALLPPGTRVGSVYQWTVGKETVIVALGSMSAGEVDRARAAMLAASPRATLERTEAALPRIAVLGGFFEIADRADRLAPAQGESVLLDRSYVRWISTLAKTNAPIYDRRTIYLSNIPMVRGVPDYSKATVHWPKTVAVSPAGVKAIDAMLAASGTDRNDCRCELLVNRPGAKTYRIWRIPIAAAEPVRKYAVDARTLAVTAVP